MFSSGTANALSSVTAIDEPLPLKLAHSLRMQNGNDMTPRPASYPMGSYMTYISYHDYYLAIRHEGSLGRLISE